MCTVKTENVSITRYKPSPRTSTLMYVTWIWGGGTHRGYDASYIKINRDKTRTC